MWNVYIKIKLFKKKTCTTHLHKENFNTQGAHIKKESAFSFLVCEWGWVVGGGVSVCFNSSHFPINISKCISKSVPVFYSGQHKTTFIKSKFLLSLQHPWRYFRVVSRSSIKKKQQSFFCLFVSLLLFCCCCCCCFFWGWPFLILWKPAPNCPLSHQQ